MKQTITIKFYRLIILSSIIKQERTPMNPITYNDEDIFVESTKYQSNRPTLKKKKNSTTG